MLRGGDREGLKGREGEGFEEGEERGDLEKR